MERNEEEKCYTEIFFWQQKLNNDLKVRSEVQIYFLYFFGDLLPSSSVSSPTFSYIFVKCLAQWLGSCLRHLYPILSAWVQDLLFFWFSFLLMYILGVSRKKIKKKYQWQWSSLSPKNKETKTQSIHLIEDFLIQIISRPLPI